MEQRIEKLEEFAVEVRGELRSIDVRLTKIEVILPTLATKADLASLRHDVDKQFAAMKTDIESLRFTNKLDLDALRLSTTNDIASLKDLIHQTSASTQKWMFATIISMFLGFTGMVIGMGNVLKTAAQTPPAITAPQAQQPLPR